MHIDVTHTQYKYANSYKLWLCVSKYVVAHSFYAIFTQFCRLFRVQPLSPVYAKQHNKRLTFSSELISTNCLFVIH